MQKQLKYSLAGLTAMVPMVGATDAAAKDSRPNFVLIMAEDMTLDLSCYGCNAVQTPNLDRLASEGILYTNAHCSSPISSPSRSSMLTGINCTAIDASNHRSNRDKPLPEGVFPFTYYLRNAGYRCVLGAKDVWRNPFSDNLSQSSYKVDCNFRYTETGPYDGVENFGIFDCFDTLPDNAPFFNQITIFTTHRGDWWEDIRRESGHPVDPDKVVLPEYMADHPKIRYEFAAYLDQVEYMDAEVGKIMARLERDEHLNNTIVIFIGDNGRADLRGKGFLYEDGTRVPMIIWDGRKIHHQVVDDLVGTIDIAATMLSLAGVPVPDNMESRPLLDKKRRPCLDRDYLYTARDTWDEVPECIRAVNDGRYVYIKNYFPEYPYDRPQVYLDFHRPALWVMRALKAEGRLKGPEMLFFTDTKPAEELYDCATDPQNLVNLAGRAEYSAVMGKLKAVMDDRISNVADYGIADRKEREKTTTVAKNNLRDYMQKYHPDEWESLTSGDLWLDYTVYGNERKEFQKRQKEDYKPGTAMGIVKYPNPKGLEKIREAGFEYVEVQMNAFWRNRPETEVYPRAFEAAKAIEESGLKVWSCHLPFSKDMDVSVLDPKKREANVAFMEKIIELCGIFHPQRLVLHPGADTVKDSERQQRLECSRNSIGRLALAAAKIGAVLCVENLPRTCPGRTSEEIMYLIGPYPDVMCCFDTNHLLIEDHASFFNAVKGRIGTIHASDYDRDDEKHWRPGHEGGVIDWKNFYRMLKESGYEGVFMFEVSPKEGDTPETIMNAYDSVVVAGKGNK